MGKFMLNGKEYGGSGDTASNITYDSTASGNGASTVQSAIDINSEKIDTLNESLFDLIYPIGSVYISINSINPTNMFGGVWEQIKDTFLLSAGDNYSVSSTGGSTIHTHEYGIQYGGYYRSIALENNVSGGVLNYHEDGTTDIATCIDVGSIEAEVNAATTKSIQTISMTHQKRIGNASYTSTLPPYLVVCVWKRTA